MQELVAICRSASLVHMCWYNQFHSVVGILESPGGLCTEEKCAHLDDGLSMQSLQVFDFA